jgi:hypothetical protein
VTNVPTSFCREGHFKKYLSVKRISIKSFKFVDTITTFCRPSKSLNRKLSNLGFAYWWEIDNGIDTTILVSLQISLLVKRSWYNCPLEGEAFIEDAFISALKLDHSVSGLPFVFFFIRRSDCHKEVLFLADYFSNLLYGLLK